MAISIKPTKEYLHKYISPLWEILGLTSLEVLTIVEGKQDAYPYSIIEIQHAAHTGAFSLRRYGPRDVSTFFIITLPENTKRCIAAYPAEAQVSVDNHHLYLTVPSVYLTPAENKSNRHAWDEVLQQAIKAAEGLEEGAAESDKFHGSTPTYTQVGSGGQVHRLMGHVFVSFAALLILYGLGIIFGFIDYSVSTCVTKGHNQCERVVYHYTKSESFSFGLQLLLGGGIAYVLARFEYKRAYKRRAIDNARIIK